MDELTQTVLMLKYGVGAACVLATLFIFFQVFKFIYDLKNKESKDDKDQSAKMILELEEALHANTAALNMLKKDLSRYYFGMKFLAGERWPEVRGFIEEDRSRE